MKKSEIQQILQATHQGFCLELKRMNTQQLNKSLPEKWSAAQHADHIINSIKPLVKYLMAPRKVMEEKYGLSGRMSVSQEELKQKYNATMATGVKAFGVFLPAEKNDFTAQELCAGMMQSLTDLLQQVDFFTEEDLDAYLCPHPALGLLTIREMLYFTDFHARHHQQSAKAGAA